MSAESATLLLSVTFSFISCWSTGKLSVGFHTAALVTIVVARPRLSFRDFPFSATCAVLCRKCSFLSTVLLLLWASEVCSHLALPLRWGRNVRDGLLQLARTVASGAVLRRAEVHDGGANRTW